MLIFKREGFAAGTTLVREPVEKGKDGPFKIYLLKVADQGKAIEFLDDDYVLTKYPTMFKKAPK